MKSSLWVVVVLVSGFIGFLIGYSVSAHTGTSAAETITATTQKPVDPAAASPGGYGQPAAAAGGYGEKPAAPAPAGAASPGTAAAPATAAAAAVPEKPAAPRKAAPRAAPEKKGGTTGGY